MNITPFRRDVLRRIARGDRPHGSTARQAMVLAKEGLLQFMSHKCEKCGRYTHTTWELTEAGKSVLAEGDK